MKVFCLLALARAASAARSRFEFEGAQDDAASDAERHATSAASTAHLLRGAAPLMDYRAGDVLFGDFKLTSFVGVHLSRHHSLAEEDLGELLAAAKDPSARRPPQETPQVSQASTLQTSDSALHEAGPLPPQPAGYPKKHDVLGRQVDLIFPPQPHGFRVLDKHLGSGNFGDVWRATTSDGAPVVLKFMVDSATRRHSLASEAPAEVKAEYFKDCHVPRLVAEACRSDPGLCTYAQHFGKCYSTTADGSEAQPVYVALEDAGPGCMDLEKWVQEGTGHDDYETIKDLTGQLYKALALLHHLGWVHQDVKPENIMIRADLTLWLIDFGCANELLDPQDQRFFGDQRWLGPEKQAQPARTSVFVDMWSSGLTVLYLFTGKGFVEGIVGKHPTMLSMGSMALAEQKLMGGAGGIQRVLQDHFCGRGRGILGADRCASTELFGHLVRESSVHGAGQATPKFVALCARVFRRSPASRETADAILGSFFGVAGAPRPLTSAEKTLYPPMPVGPVLVGPRVPGGGLSGGGFGPVRLGPGPPQGLPQGPHGGGWTPGHPHGGGWTPGFPHGLPHGGGVGLHPPLFVGGPGR